MDTLSELIDYCKTDNPVGALLLTGEWGCGKTYLIENPLKNALANHCIIIRISLFGISSIESIHGAVKKLWLGYRTCGISDKVDPVKKNLFDPFKKILSQMPHVGKIADIAEGVFSVNILDFIKIENTIGDKKVILVFDDLERSNLNTVDVLGAVNDYCENKHFNTIIIANEEKIKENNQERKKEISYDEIKEKIIQRIIRYTIDYEGVVKGIVEELSQTNTSYAVFLKTQIDNLTSVFSGRNLDGISLDEITIQDIDKKEHWKDSLDEKERKKTILKQRQHNIRSLKYAIQDFKRVFDELIVIGMDAKDDNDDLQEFFLSFVSFILVEKAGLYKKDERYGGMFAESIINLLYPGVYSSSYVPPNVKRWIIDGVWDQEAVDNDLMVIVRRIKAKSVPEELVKYSDIHMLDEDVIQDGFKSVLNEAYDGELELNDYVKLISNSRLSREYDYQLPETIDWDKICEGINKKIESLIDSGITREIQTVSISDHEKYTEDELRAYKLIENLRNNDDLMFSYNRRQYIESMKDNSESAFRICHDKRFNCFDGEMARVTAKAFEREDNYRKCLFAGYFDCFWEPIIESIDFMNCKAENKVEGFVILVEELGKLVDRYKDRAFAKKHTEVFICVVQKMMESIQ